MRRLRTQAFVAALALGACASNPSSNNPPVADTEFQTLKGEEARSFALPTSFVLVASHDTSRGRVYERYQQMFGDASVLGAQLTLHRDRQSGKVELVLGSHHEAIRATNRVVLDEADVSVIAGNALELASTFNIELVMNPATGRYHYNVEGRGDALRHFLWIDAETGHIINEYDGLTSGCDWNGGNPGGLGFLGEQIDLTGMVTGDVGSGYTLDSGRQVTRDLGSQRKPFYGTADADTDGCYDTVDRESPGQGALVSAHRNVAAADGYFQARGLDLAVELGTNQLTVWAHKDVDYVNAYWDGEKMVFGDGNGSTFRELVSLDIAAHELTHAVTDVTSDLIYQDESGALNESFSDIMGAAIEFQMEGASADWLMGEDAMYSGAGLRNMADPTTHDDPGHYCDRYTGTSDNGGVHSNSGISNKAFYLLATDIGTTAAADIFYEGFTGLTSNATFLNARSATEAVAPAELTANVSAAWDAVGVGPDVVCDAGPDCSADGVCNADCATGDDPDCTTEPDCSADGTCNADCAAGDDPDCGGSTCELGQPGDACSAPDECCSNKCTGKPGARTCK